VATSIFRVTRCVSSSRQAQSCTRGSSAARGPLCCEWNPHTHQVENRSATNQAATAWQGSSLPITTRPCCALLRGGNRVGAAGVAVGHGVTWVIEEGFLGHIADVIFPILMIVGAVFAILRPVVIVRWAKRAHPDLPEDDERVLWIARFIGVVLLGIGGFILMIIVSAA